MVSVQVSPMRSMKHMTVVEVYIACPEVNIWTFLRKNNIFSGVDLFPFKLEWKSLWILFIVCYSRITGINNLRKSILSIYKILMTSLFFLGRFETCYGFVYTLWGPSDRILSKYVWIFFINHRKVILPIFLLFFWLLLPL